MFWQAEKMSKNCHLGKLTKFSSVMWWFAKRPKTFRTFFAPFPHTDAGLLVVVIIVNVEVLMATLSW